ncbi:MAG: glycosyltransferase [Thermoleophilaceae bacterium]
MDICTIIAKNYVPFARVLARSLAEQRPGARCFTLVIDEPRGYIDPAEEPFELVEIADLEIPRFDRMAAMYDVLELSTAVKPWLLRHLIERRGVERVAYLDPDIRLFDPLDEVDALLREHPVVVTPHLAEPMPRDGAKPSERDILSSGAYNLGFLGLSASPEVERLLEWWSERLATDCIVAPEDSLFVDQRWIDLAPGLLDGFHVLRDPGYNVAYWNLAGRTVRRGEQGYEVNGRPLRFFHFSGFDPRIPTRLSKHQNRIRLERRPAVAELCRSYAADLLDGGFAQAGGWPYSWARLPGGVALDKALRRTCRDAVLADELATPPFTAEGAKALLAWANEPAEEGGEVGITRYLLAFHQTREDLKRELPDPGDADAARLLAWAEVYGRGQIASELMPAAGSPAALPGVNLTGYFSAVLGVGEAARQVIEALSTQGVPIAATGLIADASPGGGDDGVAVTERRDAPYAINLMCVNADQVAPLARDLGHAYFQGRYTIGLWWWEVNRLPERWREAFEHVDEVWVGSRHVAEALTPISPVPVIRVTLPVARPQPRPTPRAELGFPAGFVFLLVFDYHSVFERKNPLALVEAFEQGFAPGEGAALVLKCINHEHYPEQHARLLAAAGRHPDVHVLDRHVDRAEKDAMIAACDCYASLHRAEGFGITLAEAMALGKPVLATGYSGNLDFMRAENSFLVDHRLVKVGAGSPPYPADADWAEPDVAHAARLMREVFEDRAAAAERGAGGRAELLASHCAEAAGRTMARRLLRVRSFAGARGLRGPLRIADTTVAAELVRSGPVQPSPPSRLGAARTSARAGLLRLLKPFAVHQQRVDHELLRAIHTLDATVRSLAATQVELERALTDLRASPFTPAEPFELSEHPVAGVVVGFRDGGAGATAAPQADAEAERGADELLEGCEPLLELDETAPDPAALLERTDPGSLGAVRLRSLAGRLDDAGVRRLVAGALAALAPDGVLLAEEPNPHSLRVARRLAGDPHRPRAVYPEELLDRCRAAGFAEGFAFHPGGLGNVEADRHREEAFAVLCRAPAGGGAQAGVAGQRGSVPGRD